MRDTWTEADIIIGQIKRLLESATNFDGYDNEKLASFLARESEKQFQISDKKLKITHFSRSGKKLPIQLEIVETMQEVFSSDKKVAK